MSATVDYDVTLCVGVTFERSLFYKGDILETSAARVFT